MSDKVSTMEGNSQQMTPDIFRDFFENLEEFLETYEVEDPVMCQRQLCTSMAPQSPASTKDPECQDSILDQVLEELPMHRPTICQAQASPQEPTQNQATTLDLFHDMPQSCVSLSPQGPADDKESAVDQLLEERMDMTSWEQNMSCSAQSNPTAASQLTPNTDVLKTFLGDQTLPEGSSKNSVGDQTPVNIGTPLSDATEVNAIQMFFTGDQTLHGIQKPFCLGGFVSGNEIPITGAQVPWGSITSFTGDQAQWVTQISPTAHRIENARQMTLRMDTFIQQDFTMEDMRQEKAPDTFHENHAHFLQSCEAEDPNAPEPELCAPTTSQGPGSTGEIHEKRDILDQLLEELQIPRSVTLRHQASSNKPSQKKAKAPDPLRKIPLHSESLNLQSQGSPQLPTEEKDSVLDQILEELMDMTSWEQNMNCSSQSKSTCASHMTPDTDVLKTFSGDQTLPEGQIKTPGSEQTPSGDQMTYTGTQTLDGMQMPFLGAQMLWANQIPFGGHQIPCESQMSRTGQQTGYGTPISISMNQSFSRNQVPFTASQMLLVNQVPFSGVHTINGKQMLQPGVQMIPVTGHPTMTFIGDQTSTGIHPVTQSDTQSLYGNQMVPQGLPLPQSGLMYASVPLVQGPSPEIPRPKKRQRREYHINSDGLKRYACTFEGCGKEYSKASHLRIHERIHTGVKPYVCDVKGCPWKFPRSDELSRHKKTHKGERPYSCPQCQDTFARLDHLKQHARVHR